MMYVVDKEQLGIGLVGVVSRVAGQPKSMQTELINHVRQSC